MGDMDIIIRGYNRLMILNLGKLNLISKVIMNFTLFLHLSLKSK
jgi:hypothetical protein